MALLSYDKEEDFNLFIAFHPPKEEHLLKVVEKLDKLFTVHFPEDFQREFVSEEEAEAVYRVKKPFFLSEDSLNSFFEQLGEVFNKTVAYSPHFIDWNEVARHAK